MRVLRRPFKKFLSRRSLSSSGSSRDSKNRVFPILKPTSAPWVASMTPADTRKLIKGYTAMDMDNRWECETEGPDEEGMYLAKLARSWTGFTILAIRFQVELEGEEESRVQTDLPPLGVVREIFWETDTERYSAPNPTADDMKGLARTLCQNSMGVEIHDEVVRG